MINCITPCFETIQIGGHWRITSMGPVHPPTPPPSLQPCMGIFKTQLMLKFGVGIRFYDAGP